MVDVSIAAENVTELRSLHRGDHIAVDGETAGVKYYHHGIFLGHSIGVADFGGTRKWTATVRIVDVLKFINYGKRQLVRYMYQSSECLPDEEAAKNAEALAANPRLWGAYDLVKNNCEHFATRCKVGRAVSFQVIEKLHKLGPVLFDAAVAACSSATALSASGSLSVDASVYMTNKARR